MSCDPAFVPNTPRFAALANRLQWQAKVPSLSNHLVVPVGLTAIDHAAISLAVSLAALQQSRVTLLHVIEGANQEPLKGNGLQPPTGLDAIGCLHNALLCLASQSLQQQEAEARSKLQQKLDRDFPKALRRRVDIRIKCCFGEYVEEVVQYCNTEVVDLLILPSRLSWWGLPLVSAKTRQVIREANPPALIAPVSKPTPKPTRRIRWIR